MKLRSWLLGIKWFVLWKIIYALGLEEWFDARWYAQFKP